MAYAAWPCAGPASPIAYQSTKNGHSRRLKRRATKRCRSSTPPIRRRPGSPAEAESARSLPTAFAAQPGGTFGTNSNGLDDLAGNVLEWTNCCFLRISLDGKREQITNTNCGVRVVEGAHRTYMTDFIRDPRAGGCAAGIPPANLGFRLVAEPARSVATSVVPKRDKSAAAGLAAPAIAGGLSQRKVPHPRVR